MTASSCEFQNYLGAVMLSSSLTQDSRSSGSVTVWAIVTPTCNIVRQQHLFSSCYNCIGYLQWNPSFSDPLELFNQNYKRSSCEPTPLGCKRCPQLELATCERVKIQSFCMQEMRKTRFREGGCKQSAAYESVCQESLHYVFKVQKELI